MLTIFDDLKETYAKILNAEFEGKPLDTFLQELSARWNHANAALFKDEDEEGIIFTQADAEKKLGKYVIMYPYPFVAAYVMIDDGAGNYKRVHQKL